MDLLTDILGSADIQKSLIAQRAFYSHWAVRFPCENSIGFHAVTQGEVYIRGSGLEQPLLLKKGDLLLVAKGFDHELATKLDMACDHILQFPVDTPAPGQRPLVTLASGVYHFAATPLHPLFKEIPQSILLRADDIAAHAPLHAALLLLSSELSNRDLGSEAVTRNLLDILFHYILRNWISSISDNPCRWNVALRDKHLLLALESIHAKPESNWTVDDLAGVAGASRASFAEKFKRLTGETPALYVSKVRIQKAARILRQGRHNVEQTAELVGYQDAFVFSKIFKRLQGQSPRDYRKSFTAAHSV